MKYYANCMKLTKTHLEMYISEINFGYFATRGVLFYSTRFCHHLHEYCERKKSLKQSQTECNMRKKLN